MDLGRYLAELGASRKPLPASRLVDLSNLSPEELKAFGGGWPSIKVGRRREIAGLLVDLAEDNVELDFSGVFRACLRDLDETVRTKAIEGLWECEDRTLVPQLIELLAKDSKECVRAAAATALGRFALLGELEKLCPGDTERIGDALLNVIDNPSEHVEVRRRALEAVAPLSPPRVKQAIFEAYRSDNPRMSTSALYAMGMSCDPEWLPTLIKELKSPDPERRFEAAGALGELEEEAAVPRLAELVHDLDAQVQLSVIHALGRIGGSEAREALQAYLDDPDERICRWVEEVIEGMELEEGPLWL